MGPSRSCRTELYLGTDPENPDSDGDGVPDGEDLAPLSEITPTPLQLAKGDVAPLGGPPDGKIDVADLMLFLRAIRGDDLDGGTRNDVRFATQDRGGDRSTANRYRNRPHDWWCWHLRRGHAPVSAPVALFVGGALALIGGSVTAIGLDLGATQINETFGTSLPSTGLPPPIRPGRLRDP
jgi:hypothetical protein